MKKVIMGIIILLTGSNLHSGNKLLNIETVLKNHQREGYKFLKKVNESSWLVQFQSPDWEYSWKINVFLSKHPSDPDFDVVYIWTNVLELDRKPSDEVLEYILKLNAQEGNWGFFSLDSENGKWYIDYNVKMRYYYLNKNQLIESIGWVAGYANGIYNAIEEQAK